MLIGADIVFLAVMFVSGVLFRMFVHDWIGGWLSRRLKKREQD